MLCGRGQILGEKELTLKLLLASFPGLSHQLYKRWGDKPGNEAINYS